MLAITSIALALLGPTLTQCEPIRALNRDFPDPSIIKTDSGYFSFATNSGGRNVQVAHLDNNTSWDFLEGYDALPGPFPEWVADDPAVWAPDVFQRDDGKYVMYYSARPRAMPKWHCLGVATSSEIEGPYTPVPGDAFACPLDKGGAIDAAGFKDTDGTLYVTYKVDGSALNKPNTTDYHPTPLVLQQVKADGFTKVGEPVTLLDRIEEDGQLIEAPSIAVVDGVYYLFFSSHFFKSPDYDSKYATAESVAGPYTRAGRVVAPGDPSSAGPLSGPGGADISADGKRLVFHANLDNVSPDGGRGMYSTRVKLEDGKVALVNGTAST